MKVEEFVKTIGADFYTGVPDSLLKPLCDYLTDQFGSDPRRHLIAANEGNAVGIAAGYHLATGRAGVVYMQNSGEGNVINPAASLLHEKVYCIPVIFVVGWRGEPGVHDEPQHIYQGEITLRLLEDMGIRTFVLGKETTVGELEDVMAGFRGELALGKDVAIVVRKGALNYERASEHQNAYPMRREEIIRHIVAAAGKDVIVSTTGKASRELFEIREANGQGHGHDFLTVGSMGHSSSIALGIALQRPEKTVWCIDGDGAALMHMGALAVIGSVKPKNLIHVAINNGAHESVGGMPTAAGGMDLAEAARACGYPRCFCVEDAAALDAALQEARERRELCFLEVKCAVGARADLGRPTRTARENKEDFMKTLAQ